ncbi:MAG: DUF58 domain-containing protein [Polyangia bacterium]|nr:DUF58 domain-containing protein [Polyangia bacterium]
MTPRGRLIALVALAALPFAAAPWYPEGIQLGTMANLFILTLAILDRVLTPSPRRIALERRVSDVLSVGTPNPVTLRVENRSGQTLRLELLDAAPEPSRTIGLPLRLKIPSKRTREVTYHLRPGQRGKGIFSALHLRYPSRLGLWTLQQTRPIRTEVKIYPDIQAVHRFELLARKNRLSEEGLKLWRLRGRGGEFERLREYRREDEPRHVDWKATAKYERLISREYTVERNQNVLFLLDCGRSMVNESEGVSHLDRGLNSAITLAYIALSQGDNVSFMAFSHRIERAVGPVRGKLAVQKIIRTAYDLEPRYEASDYSLAIEEVLRRQRRRALVVLVTHALDEQQLLALSEYVRPVTGRHVLLVALLQDMGLTGLASRLPATDLDAFRAASAGEILAAQARLVRKLRDWGVLVVETSPGELSAVVINQYLDVKARHLL